MLVLTRKKNDSIVIDGRITIEVLQVKGGGIRLGITAPPEVSILRGELKPFGVETSQEQSGREELGMTLRLDGTSLSNPAPSKKSRPVRDGEVRSSSSEGRESSSQEESMEDSLAGLQAILARRRMMG